MWWDSTYAWTSARSHAHHLIHYATASQYQNYYYLTASLSYLQYSKVCATPFLKLWSIFMCSIKFWAGIQRSAYIDTTPLVQNFLSGKRKPSLHSPTPR
ncbi:hypothetical protein E2C01_100466 [Portunus trituberculatus]|uniref:Uncharacterized protein n=1 Tax=Portunus trituberculatus TaxID=210409 RepID=A0A5B7KCA5_PORTR|nr:hypothetical protein [Portunus trituberculatus]